MRTRDTGLTQFTAYHMKIKAGTMRTEEAVDYLRGTGNYKYKLNAYDARKGITTN